MSEGLGFRDGYGMGGGARRRRPIGTSITRVGLVIAFAFGALAGGAGWWQVVESPSLSSAPDNPAVVAAGRRAVRGEIVDRTGEWLARSDRDANGEPFRIYRSTTLSPVLGYSSQLGRLSYSALRAPASVHPPSPGRGSLGLTGRSSP